MQVFVVEDTSARSILLAQLKMSVGANFYIALLGADSHCKLILVSTVREGLLIPGSLRSSAFITVTLLGHLQPRKFVGTFVHRPRGSISNLATSISEATSAAYYRMIIILNMQNPFVSVARCPKFI